MDVERAFVCPGDFTPAPAKAEAVGQRLRDYLRSVGIAAAPVLACVGRDRVILKELRHPSVPASEEAALVRFQASKELTDSAESMVIDYAAKGPAAPNGEKTAFAFAIRRDVARSAEDELAVLGGLEIVDEVLRRSDYLVITLPATPATLGLIGERELGAMKRTAVLVNVSRAAIVDEHALYRALAERTIAGAALDVWYRYPTGAGATLPATASFHELPNVLMTPHVSGWTEGMLEARAKLIAENIQRTARGESPLNLIR